MYQNVRFYLRLNSAFCNYLSLEGKNLLFRLCPCLSWLTQWQLMFYVTLFCLVLENSHVQYTLCESHVVAFVSPFLCTAISLFAQHT